MSKEKVLCIACKLGTHDCYGWMGGRECQCDCRPRKKTITV